MSLAYAGAGHTRPAAIDAVVAALAAHDFGDLRSLRAGHPDPDLAATWPPIDNAPLSAPALVDDAGAIDWHGVTGLVTRLSVVTETASEDPYLGEAGAEVSLALDIDWMVMASASHEAWRRPAFDAGLAHIGAVVAALRAAPPPAFLALAVGQLDFAPVDIGDHQISAVSIPLQLTLDSVTAIS